MKYYECHITIEEDRDRSLIQQAVENVLWKFSAITGDPVLGKKRYCYATKHFKEELGDLAVKEGLLEAAQKLRQRGLVVLRSKVEMVIYDDRSLGCALCPRGLITAEQERQVEKWGEQNHTQMIWLGILAEEFGEVAKEVNELHFRVGDPQKIKEELVQVAAVAVSMYESLERNGI
jgi:NTP pyrophosphatase (non-canonical NTP hydrolase)